jgi:hypothetical protein
MPSSFSSSCNHNNFVVVKPIVLYSASVDERATVDCFLQDHEIAFEPRYTFQGFDLDHLQRLARCLCARFERKQLLHRKRNASFAESTGLLYIYIF